MARANERPVAKGTWTRSAKTLALSVLGIVLSGSAVLQRMAESIYLQGISSAKMSSIERRLARFVENLRIKVRSIWTQFLSHILPYWKGKAVQVVLDCTPVDAPLDHRVRRTASALAGAAAGLANHASPRALGTRTVGTGGRTAGRR